MDDRCSKFSLCVYWLPFGGCGGGDAGAYLFINILDIERTDLKYIVKCQVHNIFAEKRKSAFKKFYCLLIHFFEEHNVQITFVSA